jgi:hypothetical protein
MKNFLGNLEEQYDQVDDEPAQWSDFFSTIFSIFGEKNPFSTKDLIDRMTSVGEDFYFSSENKTLKDALPESLGDIKDRGFSNRLGLTIRKHKDQIFETEQGFIQLRAGRHDVHRQKPQWILELKNVAPSAPFAPSLQVNSYTRENKILPSRAREDEFNLSTTYGAAGELGAMGALGAEDENFVFEDDPEERAAIQSESLERE